jgi:ATP-dependent Clp protease ATP-binding subunit ClpC
MSAYMEDIELQLQTATANKENAINSQNFELAVRLREEERRLAEKLQEPTGEGTVRTSITPEDIAQIISQMTGIEETALSCEESKKLLELEEELASQVIGQPEAVAAVARAVRRGRVGLKDPERPVGSFLFLGPTGVGKTELCRALSRALFGSVCAMIRLDMSEYMEKQSVSKLIGSPPGYVGYDDGGQLTERVRRKPYCVILFDEVEKAHADVLNLLLQLLEDGRLTDAHGRTCSFKNAVIIMTSNIGAQFITERRHFGFATDDSDASQESDIRKRVLSELKKIFRPELLNRVDEVVVFRCLSRDDMQKIALRLLDGVAKRLAAMGISVVFTPDAVELVSKEGFDPDYGARPLRRTIQNRIEDLLAEELLNKRIAQGDSVECKSSGCALVISKTH